MSATSSPKCTTCGKTVPLPPQPSSEAVKKCQECDHVDLGVYWCNEKCEKKSVETHSAKKCAGPSERKIIVEDEASYRHFCPPSCKVEIVTPRLRIRAVEFEDTPRVFKIKNDPLVSSQQLYGTVNRESQCRLMFVAGYVQNNIPCLDILGSPYKDRRRYVFGIEPRLSKDGVRSLTPQPEKVEGIRHMLDAEGYIGNIAIELSGKGGKGYVLDWLSVSGRKSGIAPIKGQVFSYPTRDEIRDRIQATIFYELHPSFWRQGVMSEALKAVIAYCFQTLQVSSITLDPKVDNGSSIALTEKEGFTLIGEKNNFGADQLIYELRVEDWEKGRKGKKKNKSKKKKVDGAEGVIVDEAEQSAVEEAEKKEETKKTCRWCQLADSNAKLGCSKCDWAYWCCQGCKTADLTYEAGHTRECPGRNGEVLRPTAKVKEVETEVSSDPEEVDIGELE